MTEARVSVADLCAALRVAEQWLAANRAGINAINVYPVPDGDTGTNMLLTFRAAIKDLPESPRHLGEVTAIMARASLLGARGNSGVIWSQMVRGFAEALSGQADTDTTGLVAALVNASRVSYSAISQPVEGTMLTVLREAAEAGAAATKAARDSDATWRALVDEAYASLERTPDLLPRLREAGVVDAGGAGVAVLLEGLSLGLHGKPLPAAPRFTGAEDVTLNAVEHEGHGYCTEFVAVIEPGSGTIDRASMERALIELGGESVLVVGDEYTAHVHVHMADPGPAISLGARAGALLSVKVENMQAQHMAWIAAHGNDHEDAHGDATPPSKALPAIGLVAVARGAGIARAFRDLGATGIVDAGDGTKASAGELLEACRAAGTEHVLLLPNDKDVLMAAETCAREAEGFVTVIPTHNAAAGLAAAVYYLPTGDSEAIADDMRGVLDSVHCVEVSVSVRDALVDGVDVKDGEAIAFVDGKLVASLASVEEALLAGLADAVEESSEIVTIYLGEGAPAGAEALVRPQIEAAHPGLEVDFMAGGQPHYPYLASIE